MGMTLTDEVLNQLDKKDAILSEIGILSLNAISGTDDGDTIRVRALLQNKVMLLLVDSGSSHSFISSALLQKSGIIPEQADLVLVKVANGQTMVSGHMLKGLQWWSQGHTFTADVRVLPLEAYDAILGMDWVKLHSPMTCHWDIKLLEFMDGGIGVKLQGIRPKELAVVELSTEQLLKWCTGNEVWAMVVVHCTPIMGQDSVHPKIQGLLQEFATLF
ncbi:hypothetical protein QOZ80_7BG0590560 [Eleusine coracana subsp. coracana]|nr:hypothetical protein QOZ80_7BG0590560 [Eleusine coracana subsp. coracana]